MLPRLYIDEVVAGVDVGYACMGYVLGDPPQIFVFSSLPIWLLDRGGHGAGGSGMGLKPTGAQGY